MTPSTNSRVPRVVYAIWQAGRSADGGLHSITEIMRHADGFDRRVVTNLSETAFTRTWGSVGLKPLVWAMVEASAGRPRSIVRDRLLRFVMRAVNNLRMMMLVLSWRADIVHCNDIRAYWSTALGARLGGARVILNIRGTPRDQAEFNVWHWRLAFRLCHVFLVLSQEMAKVWASTLSVPASSKIRYIYSIVDFDRFRPPAEGEARRLRIEHGIPDSAFVVVLVAGFHPLKRQLQFVTDVVPELTRRVPGLRVCFVGDFDPEQNSYAAACSRAVRERRLEDVVEFVGFSRNVEIWYWMADTVVVASEREGLPRCIIEGIAAGALLVSVDVCSAREILERHRCGVVVDGSDLVPLRDAIVELAGDPARRQHLARPGPAIARELFTAEHNGGAYSRMIAAVAAS